MKYLVLQSELTMQFIIFDGPGHHVSVAAEKFDVPFYVRQVVNNQIGSFSVNEVSNYDGGSCFMLKNFGCNITVDGALLPQGVSIMEEGPKYLVSKLIMFLIDEADKAEVAAGFNEEEDFYER